MNDTSPEIAEKMNELFQQKTPLERFEIGCSMLHTSKSLIIQSILREIPDISQADLRAEFSFDFMGMIILLKKERPSLKNLGFSPQTLLSSQSAFA